MAEMGASPSGCGLMKLILCEECSRGESSRLLRRLQLGVGVKTPGVKTVGATVLGVPGGKGVSGGWIKLELLGFLLLENRLSFSKTRLGFPDDGVAGCA